MASILFAGGRLDSVTSSTGISEDTTAGRFDSTYADCSLLTAASSTSIVTFTMVDASGSPVSLTSGQTGFFHYDAHFVSNTGTSAVIQSLKDSAGTTWLSIQSTGTGNTYILAGWTGSAWTQLGSSFTIGSNTRVTIDIVLTIGSPNSAQVYVNSSLVASGTWTQATLVSNGIRTLNGFSNGNGNNSIGYSQVLCAEGLSTVGGKVRYARATGAGSNSGWTSAAATNVNEAVNSDATVDQATSAGLRQTYAMGDVTVPANYVIKSVFHWLRAKNDGSTPANIKSSVRSGGTNYDAASNMAGSIGIGFSSLVQRYDTDPNTSAAWTQAGWNAAEAGYLSAA
jgi:hypothetical protein